MPQFDRFADRYTQILDDGIGISGEGSSHFAEMKARYCAARLPAPATSFTGKVLDYGCGVGLVTAALADALPQAQLHGFDVSPESIARVPDVMRARGRFTSDESALDTDYDLALVANVMHHIPPAERARVARGIAGRLKPGGKLVIIEHNMLNPATRFIVATCALDEDAVLLPRREAVRHLEGAGLRVKSVDYIAFFPKALARLRPIEQRLRWLPLGAQYAVVAER